MRDVLLLDFDGTITRRDTTRYLVLALLRQRPWLAFAILPHVLTIMSSRDGDRIQNAKNFCIGTLLKNLDNRQVDLALMDYSVYVNQLIRKDLKQLINEKTDQNWLTLVVTASPDFAVSFALRGFPVTVIGTRFARERGEFTGFVEGLPCYGVNKPECVRQAIADTGEDLRFSEAWSDSVSDLPMMKMAKRRVWVYGQGDSNRFRLVDPDGVLSDLDEL